MTKGPRRLLTQIIFFLLLFALACMGEIDDVLLSPKTTGELIALAVKPSPVSLAPGTSVRMQATGFFSNGLSRVLTDGISWSSSDPSIAEVSQAGVLSAIASSGTATITATSGTVSGSTVATVSPLASLAVTPSNVTTVPGTSSRFQAIGILENTAIQDFSNSAVWSSSDAAIATSPGSGVFSIGTSTLGTTIISATFSGLTATTALTSADVASLRITPSSSTVVQGKSRQFTAQGVFANDETQDLTQFVAWSSENPAVAVVSGSGLALSVAEGSALITATFRNAAGSAVLTVAAPTLDSISVTPRSETITRGASLQYNALGVFSNGTKRDITSEAAWISSDPSVASISNLLGSEGLATALKAGTARISATFLDVNSNSATLVVTSPTSTQPGNSPSIVLTPFTPSLRLGSTMQFTASIVDAFGATTNITLSATWTSSNPSVASVSQGFATAFTSGSTLITVTSGSFSASTVLFVTAF